MGLVEGSADLLFYAWPCGIFEEELDGAFSGGDKLFAKVRFGKKRRRLALSV